MRLMVDLGTIRWMPAHTQTIRMVDRSYRTLIRNKTPILMFYLFDAFSHIVGSFILIAAIFCSPHIQQIV